MARKYTLLEISNMTGIHKNTIQYYVTTEKLKADMGKNEDGKTVWLVDADDLYNSNIPRLIEGLGPQDVERRLEQKELPQSLDFNRWAEEIMRLNRELVAATEELGVLRGRLPALEAGQAEKEQMKQEISQLQTVKETLTIEKISAMGERDKLVEKAQNLKEGLSRTEADLNKLKSELMDAQNNARWSYRRRMKQKQVTTDTN